MQALPYPSHEVNHIGCDSNRASNFSASCGHPRQEWPVGEILRQARCFIFMRGTFQRLSCRHPTATSPSHLWPSENAPRRSARRENPKGRPMALQKSVLRKRDSGPRIERRAWRGQSTLHLRLDHEKTLHAAGGADPQGRSGSSTLRREVRAQNRLTRARQPANQGASSSNQVRERWHSHHEVFQRSRGLFRFALYLTRSFCPL